MADITDATGLTKGSIYGNFENKDEVALAAYRHNISAIRKRLFPVVNETKPAIERLLHITSFYRNNWRYVSENGGCPILNASIEADDNLPFLKRYVQASIRDWAAMLSDIMETGKINHEVRRDIQSLEYAHLIITLIEGGVMMAKINNEPRLLNGAMDRIDMIIRSEIAK
ncbi:unnamed protein product [Sphagnum jensenii]|uniref:Tetracyclin repressor-like C-terminal domain-containing protein n=1 Tax=Sphagnum jensenii TaxID=128206 RepID=A0ABP0VFR9_9BRYO